MRPKPKDGKCLAIPDVDQTVSIDGATISGDFGPSVVITTDTSQAVNIAGGHATGNIYQKTSSSQSAPLGTVLDFASRLNDIDPKRKEWIRGAIMAIAAEVAANGINFNKDYLEKFFLELSRLSPAASDKFLEWMKQQSASEAYRIAANTLDVLHRN